MSNVTLRYLMQSKKSQQRILRILEEDLNCAESNFQRAGVMVRIGAENQHLLDIEAVIFARTHARNAV